MAGNFVDSLVIGIGLDTSQIAQGVQQVGAQLDSGLSAAAQSAASKMSPLGEALKGLADRAGEVAKPAEEGLQALHDLGVRSTEEIQQALAKVKEGYEAIRNDATLTDRDKAAALTQTKAKIEQLEMELKRGLPQAAAQGFAGAEAAASKFKGALSSIWAQVSGPLLGAFTVGSAVSNYISNSMAAGELAEKLKVDVEEIQIWSGAMERAGGSASGLQATIEKLNASGKAQGDAIGVLLGLADKAGTMSKEAFVQKAKELEIDEKTIEVLSQGRKALDEHLKRQRELGAYTKEDAEQSKKFKQSLADLLAAWDGFTSFIGRFTVPMMRFLADVLTDVVVFMRQHTPFVVAAITMIGAALAVRLLPPLRELPKLIAGVSKAFLRWMPFVAVIAVLALLIDDFWTYLQGGESELAEFWAIFGTGPEILAALNSAWEETKSVLAAIGTGLAQLVRYWYDLMKASGMFAALGQTFKGLLQILKGIFTLDWSLLGEGLSNVLNGLVKSVAATFKGLGMMVRDLAQAIWNALRESLPGFAKWGDGVAEVFEGIFNLDFSKLLSGIGKVFSGAGSMIATAVKGWLRLCANAWSAIIEVFTGQKIDLAGWVDKAWKGAVAVFNNAKAFVAKWISGLFGDAKLPDFTGIAKGIWDGITKAFDDVKKWIGKWFDGLFEGVKLPSIGDILGGAGDLAKGAAGAAAGLAKGAGDLLGKGLDLGKDALGKAGDFFGGLLGDAKDGAAKIGEKLGPMLSEGIEEAKTRLGKAGDLLSDLIGAGADGAAKIGEKLGPALRDGIDIAKQGAGAVSDFFQTLFGDAQPATDEAGGKIQDGMDRTAAAVRDGFNAAWSATRDFAVTQFQSAATTIQGIFAGIVSGIEAQVGALVAGAQAMLPQPGMVPASAGVRPQQAGGGRNVHINQSNRTVIHAPGGDPAQVRQAAESGQGKSNRALVQAAQRGTVQK